MDEWRTVHHVLLTCLKSTPGSIFGDLIDPEVNAAMSHAKGSTQWKTNRPSNRCYRSYSHLGNKCRTHFVTKLCRCEKWLQMPKINHLIWKMGPRCLTAFHRGIEDTSATLRCKAELDGELNSFMSDFILLSPLSRCLLTQQPGDTRLRAGTGL